MEHTREVGRPVFIDFTGHGYVNCLEMEARVWSDLRVLKLLREEYLIEPMGYKMDVEVFVKFLKDGLLIQ